MTTSVAALATRLLELHHTGSTLVLPNVWDAWSAKVVAEAGFGALSIGSHPLADSRGPGRQRGHDARRRPRRRTTHLLGRAGGPGDRRHGGRLRRHAQELVERLLEAGAVGLNIEDTVHSEGGRMRSAAEHADYIGAIRQAADAAGVDLVVNARTDVFLKKDQFADPVGEAATRLRACEEAGARCVYPVGVPDAAALQALLDALSGPVNVIANPRTGSAAGSLEDLQVMGVHRVTFGPKLMQELAPDLTALVTPWR